jgi:hypothetical protein
LYANEFICLLSTPLHSLDNNKISDAAIAEGLKHNDTLEILR